MRIALVADLHGNRPAVEALDRDLAITRPDRVYCLGDMVGKGPTNDFTFDWARAHCDGFVAGNWDIGIGFKQYERDNYYWDQLGPERMAFLRSIPLEMEILLSGRRIRLFHGRPVMKKLIMVQNDREDIDALFLDEKGARYDVLAYADAHRQALRTMTPGLFLNVGSVGNGLGETKCCYAILEGEEGSAQAPFEVRFRQVPYDRQTAVADALNAVGAPKMDEYISELQTGHYCR